MIDLLKRWAALEPAWCHIDGRRIYFGPSGRQEWVETYRKQIPWRAEGAIQKAVILAMDERAWIWERGADGSLTVGHPDGVQSVVLSGTDFTADLLNAYVQRLEIARYLLAD
ncbi:MAG: hypothetical protein R2834_14985 [Rhodothermales bacterium]